MKVVTLDPFNLFCVPKIPSVFSPPRDTLVYVSDVSTARMPASFDCHIDWVYIFYTVCFTMIWDNMK